MSNNLERLLNEIIRRKQRSAIERVRSEQSVESEKGKKKRKTQSAVLNRPLIPVRVSTPMKKLAIVQDTFERRHAYT